MTFNDASTGSSGETASPALGLTRTKVAKRVSAAMPQVVSDLSTFVAIPSCAFAGFPPEPVMQMAESTVQYLRDCGVDDARLIDVPGGYPLVYGQVDGPRGAIRVLLYAHYDVQPAAPEQGVWHTDPWTPTIRDGRLFGRGAADDKSGVVINANTIRLVRELVGHCPVSFIFVIEGEEEAGGPLPQFVLDRPDLFQADVMVIADGGNETVGVPSLEVSTRGIVHLLVEVKALDVPVHSGIFGGAAPDALISLIKMLATLHDDVGSVSVPGLFHSTRYSDSAAESGGEAADDDRRDTIRRAAHVLDGVELVGRSTMASRLWEQPSITVIGVDAPAVAGAATALVPKAGALLSLRIAPGADAIVESKVLQEHLHSVAPWGVKVSITEDELGPSWLAGTDGTAFALAREAMTDAFGLSPIAVGSGGAIPLLASLQAVNVDPEFVLWGVEDGAANIHSANESVDLEELERVLLSSVLFVLSLSAGVSLAQ